MTSNDNDSGLIIVDFVLKGCILTGLWKCLDASVAVRVDVGLYRLITIYIYTLAYHY